MVALIRRGIRPRDIMTRKAFENAITVVIALGGSTNAVLHLLAIASSAEVKLQLDDFTRIGRRVPVLADLRPSGRYPMSELVAIGGIQPLMKTLLDAGLLHGDCLTVTGATLAENLADVAHYTAGQDIVRPLSQPIKKDSHLVVLYGNLAPEGAVAKITGKEGLEFTGTRAGLRLRGAVARGNSRRQVKAGDVVVIRNEGPQGRSGHARDAESHRRHRRQRPGQRGRARSPMGAFPAAVMASWSAMFRRRRRSAARWRWSRTATKSRLMQSVVKSPCM